MSIDQHLRELAELYSRMDQAYDQAAAAHGFVCRGCADNCCRTRFHHHTLAEYLYLHRGLAQFAPADRKRVEARAAAVVAAENAADETGEAAGSMCPLNDAERCTLYAFRPMICRLHGIPHQLRRPDGRRQIGPGCGDFERQCGPADWTLLDRTPFYTALAGLEQRLRQRLKFERRIKMTVAEMIVQPLDGIDASAPSGKDR